MSEEKQYRFAEEIHEFIGQHILHCIESRVVGWVRVCGCAGFFVSRQADRTNELFGIKKSTEGVPCSPCSVPRDRRLREKSPPAVVFSGGCAADKGKRWSLVRGRASIDQEQQQQRRRRRRRLRRWNDLGRRRRRSREPGAPFSRTTTRAEHRPGTWRVRRGLPPRRNS